MMKKIIFPLFLIVCLLLPVCLPVSGQGLTAQAILDQVNEVLNAPKDQKMSIRLVLIDKDGKEETREFMMMQKGKEMRMGKFLAPASQKGIGFLSLPNDVFYVYMPAYKKTQRIAARQKSGKFAGTDFTYQDLGTQHYGDEWSSQLLGTEENQYVLELTATPQNETGYARLRMWVDQSSFYPRRVEFYDQKQNLAKILTSRKIERVAGYLVARELEMEDVQKKHKTVMFIEEVEFDTGLSDEYFTERYLSR